jgi:histidinol-phosphate/aromatic aminotransferase/cobyric acid decarboxylase-like protein
MVPVTARTAIRASGTASLAAFFEQRPAFLEQKAAELLGGGLFSFKHVLMFSGATALMSHAVHTTLPLAWQLAFHGSNTLALLAFHTAPVVHVMRAVAFSGDFQSICTFLNALLALAQVDIEHSAGGPGLPLLTCDLFGHACCHRHAVRHYSP